MSQDEENKKKILLYKLSLSWQVTTIIKEFPMAAMFVTDGLMEKVTNYIKEVLEENKEELVSIIANKLEEHLDLKDIVQKKIEVSRTLNHIFFSRFAFGSFGSRLGPGLNLVQRQKLLGDGGMLIFYVSTFGFLVIRPYVFGQF